MTNAKTHNYFIHLDPYNSHEEIPIVKVMMYSQLVHNGIMAFTFLTIVSFHS